MKQNNKLLVGIFLAVSVSAAAQESRNVTLDEALLLGLQNSKNVRADNARIEEAEAHLLEAKNRQLPELKISGSALALAHATVDLKIARPPEGGSPKANSAFFGNANFSLPVFAGGRIKYGIESAGYLVEAEKLRAGNNKTAIAYNITQAYSNLFKAEQTVHMLEENLASSQKRDKSFQKLENSGIIPRNERLKANLQTSAIELQLLEAKNSLNLAVINMDILLGLPEETRLAVDPAYIDHVSAAEPVSYYLDAARNARLDLQALDYQKKAAALAIKAAKAESLPTVALTGGYVAAEVPNILSIYNAANIGVGIQYNLDNLWKNKTEHLLAVARVKQLDASREILEDQIKIDIYRDYQNSQLALEKIAVYNKSAEQATENYRVTKNKYDNGLATITELLDADAAKLSADVNIINAKADAALAYRKLLYTSSISQN